MADYVIMSDLNARIPGTFLVQALDDDGDGVADSGTFTQVQDAVQTEINGILGTRFATPFSSPVPAIVQDAARLFACELLYKRRGVADDANPWAKQAASMRATLEKIASGKLPLAPGQERQKPSVSAITETSRAHSSKGSLTA